MCGICGVYAPDTAAGSLEAAEAVQSMTRLLARRGPDDVGYWADPDGHVQLGFRRLAIIDLSAAGHQPMVSGDGQSVIVYNGEMYNYLELRRELTAKGISFRSQSDTEVVLEALNYWGIAALERFNGMFALAWYHLGQRELLLARDHAGIKPLYYLREPDTKRLVFASQYNCLLHTPWKKPETIRSDVLTLYLQIQHVPAPYGLLEHTHQLKPGHYLLVRADGSTETRSWWSLPRTTTPDLNRALVLDMLHDTLDDAVKRQRIANVPLGVFLSGGIDSPLVTAFARAQTDSSLLAYTIGSPGWKQDETADAQAYAQKLDVDFQLRTIDDQSAVQLLQAVAEAQTEPLGDFSIIPTLLVSQAARTKLTVALSGDGGDELFFGYERPLSLLRSGSDFRFPLVVRKGLYGLGKYGLIPKRSGAIIADDPGAYYFGVNAHLGRKDYERLVPSAPSVPSDFGIYNFEQYRGLHDLACFSRWAEYYGQLQRVLKKVDMASMYHSLEVRVPILDRKVIDLSLRIDPFDSMYNGVRKAPLRDLLGRFVPPDTIPTQKRGFGVPLGDWLRGGLRPVVEDMLYSSDVYPSGWFDRRAVEAYCREHFDGTADHKWGIWTLLALQLWYRQHYLAA